MDNRYTKDLQRGLEYQDFVFDQLRTMDGMPIFLGAYSSVKYQCDKGESPSRRRKNRMLDRFHFIPAE